MSTEADRFVREKERRQITGVSTSTWYEMQSRGEAPRPIKLGRRAVGWLLSELQAWQAKRLGERDSRERGLIA
jgi:prophage regulatory protein